MNATEHCQLIERHYSTVWHPPEKRLRWAAGPIDELPAGFHVLAIPIGSDTMGFSTCCMSAPEDDERLELHVLTRRDQKRAERDVVELLTVVAHYHRTGHRLGLGHTVNFGRPWLPGSLCTHGLISLPYLDGPRLEWTEDGRVRFLWLIPITPKEVDLKKRAGLDALQEAFEAQQFDYLDPLRPSVC